MPLSGRMWSRALLRQQLASTSVTAPRVYLRHVFSRVFMSSLIECLATLSLACSRYCHVHSRVHSSCVPHLVGFPGAGVARPVLVEHVTGAVPVVVLVLALVPAAVLVSRDTFAETLRSDSTSKLVSMLRLSKTGPPEDEWQIFRTTPPPPPLPFHQPVFQRTRRSTQSPWFPSPS